MRNLALLLHLSSAIIWLGGMVFAHFCLRPSVAMLEPPQRLSLMSATLTRFFAIVIPAIVVLLATGGFLYARREGMAAPIGVHLMVGIGTIMCLLFGHLFFGPFRRMKAAVAASSWPVAADQLGKVRVLVLTNMVLGFAAITAVRLL
jgi:uncharacterized membrane protein